MNLACAGFRKRKKAREKRKKEGGRKGEKKDLELGANLLLTVLQDQKGRGHVHSWAQFLAQSQFLRSTALPVSSFKPVRLVNSEHG